MTARLDDTNTHTFFLRESEALDTVLRNIGNGSSIWSAGCSTGEEVYTLAMLARESGVEVHITGSDINRVALKVARRGRYPERRLRNVDPLRRRVCFDRVDNETYEVKEALRSSVFFTRHNIATDAPLTNGDDSVRSWDTILCRNVFLYLTADQIDFALASFSKALKPGGLLLFGASELMSSVLHSHRPRRHGLILTDLGGSWGYQRRDPSSAVLDLPDRVPSPPPAPPATRAPPEPQRDQPMADVVRALRLQGDRFLDAGDPRGALDIYEHAAQRDGLLADLHLRIAVCRLQTGSPQHAKEALRRTLFLAPELWPAAMLLGDLLEAEEPQSAERYFQQAIDALSNSSNAGLDLSGALAPFVAGRRAAVDALECRLRLLRQTTSTRTIQQGGR